MIKLPRKEKLQLESELPVGSEIRFHDVGVGTDLSAQRLISDPENLAHTAAKWHRPPVVTMHFPIGCNDGRE